MNDFVVLSIEEYKQLKEDSNFLACLEMAGVDNWSGYSYAQEMYEDGEYK